MNWLDIALWTNQLLLCALFVFAGTTKLSRSRQQMAAMGWAWAETLPIGFTRFVGTMEIVGAAGILLPTLTGIVPALTPAAAIGFVLLQLSAITLHARRGETSKTLWFNVVLLASSLFVMWGRW